MKKFKYPTIKRLIFASFNLLILATSMTSCVDTVILPENKTLDEDFWQKKTEVESVVATAYAQLRDGGYLDYKSNERNVNKVSFQRNVIVWGGFRSDEMMLANDFKSTNGITEALTELYSAQIQPNNTFTTWFPLYSCINYCNLVLEKGQGVMNYDPDYTMGDWLANKAQATALRALCYFYLVRVFRDVPVTPHAYLNSSEDLNVAQSAPAEVLEMCIKDLESVVNDAPQGNAYGDSRDRGLLNKDGINALLADIYLWRASVNHSQADYKTAVDYCDKVIKAKHDNHTFKRFDRDQEDMPYYLAAAADMYDELFGSIGDNSQNAEESIFELQYKANNVQNIALSQMYYGYSSATSGYGYVKATSNYGDYSGSGTTANIFKNTVDQRQWDYCHNTNENIEQHPIRKFTSESGNIGKTASKVLTGRTAFQQNWIIYRLTDIMLLKAEALVQLAEFEADEEEKTKTLNDAFNLVKAVNDRAINNDASVALKYTTYQDRMEELVLMERARELCFEGKRWFDLMRYNYRHVEGTDYTKKLSEMDGNFVKLSDQFYEIALNKYTAQTAMKAKMPTEPYLYLPINENELEVNNLLKQNPVYKSTSKR